MSVLNSLSPLILWKNFEALNSVPRPSKKEEKVIHFMLDFGKNLGLETQKDKLGNVLIKKPGSPGKELNSPLVLQAHLDMVHQKNASTHFDFEKEGIPMKIEGDWVKALGTTLGADNGIGVATIMAILESNDISHPPIEALFTIDEETGMTGALGLSKDFLSGSLLFNLDTEDDRELTIGCAGGLDVTATGSYEQWMPQGLLVFKKVILKGLSGGHSGMDIHLGKGNANKLMNRFLFFISEVMEIHIHSIEGGGLRNAIPRESISVLALDKEKESDFHRAVDEFNTLLKIEYNSSDPQASLHSEEHPAVLSFLSPEFQKQLIHAIYACPNGIYRMSPDIPELVQTSNNLSKVWVNNGEYSLQCLSRSSVDSEKRDLSMAIQSAFQSISAKIEFSGDYPGWTPDRNAPVVKLMEETYESLFNEKPLVNACHAGLECGIIGKHYPEMQMISFGPNIRGAHSPDERVQISSVEKYWKFLLEILKKV
jgi:dipeptidase D